MWKYEKAMWSPTVVEGPGSWGFEGPGAMKLGVHRSALVLQMVKAGCAGTCRACAGATRMAFAVESPGLWGFEGPGGMKLGVRRSALMHQVMLARCAGTSSIACADASSMEFGCGDLKSGRSVRPTMAAEGSVS